jgi:MFS family permease
MSDPSDATPPRIVYESPDAERPATASPTEAELEREKLRTPESARREGHDPYAALRYPAYRLFTIGWMIAVIGNQATAAALGWEIFDRTGSKLALGWLAGVQVIPLVLLALPAGVLADRLDRRRIVQITAAANAMCSVGLALLSYRSGTVPWMFGLLTASATVLTLGRPARSALLPKIVPNAIFSNAVTWNSSFFQVSAMVGPALGGMLISTSLRLTNTLALCYALDAACALFYAVIMAWIPIPPSPASAESSNSHKGRSPLAGEDRGEGKDPVLDYEARRPSALEQLSAGIHFVWNTKIILATLTLDLFAVLLGGAVYLLPVFAKDILHVSAFQFGLLRAAEAIGAFVMAILIAHLPPMRRAGRSMLLAVAMFGLCVIVFGLSRNFYLSLSALILLGAFDNISVVVRHTLVQVLTPDHMRGRVSAVNNVFIGASNELGGLESGLTAEGFTHLARRLGRSPEQANVLGPTWSVLFGGIGTLVTVALTAIAFPQLRRFGPLQPPPERDDDHK